LAEDVDRLKSELLDEKEKQILMEKTFSEREKHHKVRRGSSLRHELNCSWLDDVFFLSLVSRRQPYRHLWVTTAIWVTRAITLTVGNVSSDILWLSDFSILLLHGRNSASILSSVFSSFSLFSSVLFPRFNRQFKMYLHSGGQVEGGS